MVDGEALQQPAKTLDTINLQTLDTINLQTLDKITFNNQLTFMRKPVASAKKNTARQLIRQIARLRKSASEKNLQKINKILDEISEIKKLDKDEISKFAITNQKSFSQGISNSQNSMRQRGIVRIATSKAILELVKTFRHKYPTWEREVPLMIEILGIKRKVTQMSKEKKDFTDDTFKPEDEESVKPDEKEMVKSEIKVVDVMLRQSHEENTNSEEDNTNSEEESGEKKEEEQIETSKLDYGKFDAMLVSMRSVSTRAKKQIVKRLTNHAASVRKSMRKAGKFADNVELKNTIKFIKKLSSDEISKYVLAHQKQINIDENSTTTQKAMESLITAPIFQSSVNNFRSKYPNWQTEIQELLPRKYHKVKQDEQESPLYNMAAQNVNKDSDGEESSDEGSDEEDNQSATMEERREMSSDGEDADDEEIEEASDEELSDTPMEINSENSDEEEEEEYTDDLPVNVDETRSSRLGPATQMVRERTTGTTIVKRINLEDLQSENIPVSTHSESENPSSDSEANDSEAEKSDGSDPGFFIGYQSKAKKHTDMRYGRDIYESGDEEDIVALKTETTPAEYQNWAVTQLKSQIEATGDKKQPTFGKVQVSSTSLFNPGHAADYSSRAFAATGEPEDYSSRFGAKPTSVKDTRLMEKTPAQDTYLGQQKALLTGKPYVAVEELNKPSHKERSHKSAAPYAPNPNVRSAPLHVRPAASHVRGAAPHVRGAAPHVRGAASHVRGPAPHVRGAAPHVRSAVPVNRHVTSATESNKPLHPSWEAKRQQKKATTGIQKFVGKKITFDD